MKELYVHAGDPLFLGQTELDTEHEELRKHTLDVAKLARAGDQQGAFRLLAALRARWVTHFEHEEKLMRRRNYPEMAMHVREHHSFLAMVDQALNDVRLDGDRFEETMNSWIDQLINEDDRALVQWLTDSGNG